MEGRAGEVQTAALLIALRTKGETVDELVGLARRCAGSPPGSRYGEPTCSTPRGRVAGAPPSTSPRPPPWWRGWGCSGGQAREPLGHGAPGSADVLEALSVRIELSPYSGNAASRRSGSYTGTPQHHDAIPHVVPVRSELGVRTIFNFLGPLTNSAGATRQLIGVSDPAYLETIAAALRALGRAARWVVSSADGLDELSVSAATRVVELEGRELATYDLRAEDVGVEPAPAEAILAGPPDENARGGPPRGSPGTRGRSACSPCRTRARDIRAAGRRPPRRAAGGGGGHRLRRGRRRLSSASWPGHGTT